MASITMEMGSLPLLDTKVTNGKLDIAVYEEKTHTDRYLYFGSMHVKRGTVRCLYDRARKSHNETRA